MLVMIRIMLVMARQDACFLRKGFYQTKDMEHKGQVYSASPLHSLTGNFGTHIGVDGLLEQLQQFA